MESLIEKFSKVDIKDIDKLINIQKKFRKIYHLKQDLKEFGINEKKNIIKEKTRNNNQCYAFLGLGTFGEQITLNIFPETIGSASKGGMSFDNKTLDKDKNIKCAKEVKSVCLVGTKVCTFCKNKCPPLQKNCIYYNGKKFKKKSDSRATINSASHIKYKKLINEYIIYVIDYNDDKQIISIKGYKFLSNNNYFNNYILNQYNSGNNKGGICNFCPYKYDWYMSGQIMFMDVDVDISKDEPILKFHRYNPNLEIYDDISINELKKILNSTEFNLLDKQLLKNNYLKYSYISSLLTIRTKSIGKSRGVTTRK